MIDFEKFARPAGGSNPTDPEEIFRGLPKGEDIPNDLWRGQAEALRQWHDSRDASDVAVSLNTGAGKTLIGLLIAQSLVNEGVENVVYACSTIDLIYQTQKEAEKLGLSSTARIRGSFSNDLFETGRAFCITTYSSLLNTRSRFAGRSEPGAVIFDDAHNGERFVRDAFTVTVERRLSPNAYQEICRLYQKAFEDINRKQTYRDVIDGRENHIIFVPPSHQIDNSEQLAEYLRSHQLLDTEQFRYRWQHIRDHLPFCSVAISKTSIEISPPFLPTRALNLFSDKNKRRIYLSATMNEISDFVRAFGREPEVVINPRTDAGEGERLILFESKLPNSKITNDLVEKISKKQKLLISVSSYSQAENWNRFCSPPETDHFTDKLNKFRRSERGCFLLVSRFDGIDLPHDVCRTMLIDGLPSGANLIEQYQWNHLRMWNFHAAKLATRITQLFGRINRGRNDYGVFFIKGNDLNSWLQNPRNISLMPDLLQKQILLSLSVHEQSKLKNSDDVQGLVNQVLRRDKGWVKFYTETINGLQLEEEDVEKSKNIELKMRAAAHAEAAWASEIWKGDVQAARRVLEDNVEDLSRGDPKVAGWHNVWIGACLFFEGDPDAGAQEFQRARQRLGDNLALPLPKVDISEREGGKLSSAAKSMLSILQNPSPQSFDKELNKINGLLDQIENNTGTVRQIEEAVRSLGSYLGFNASRPDNEGREGPDVIWEDPADKSLLGIELKTDKAHEDAVYYKKDVSQALHHLEWLTENFSSQGLVGVILVGPVGRLGDDVSPGERLGLCTQQNLAQTGRLFAAALGDLRRKTPVERMAGCRDFDDRHDFSLAGLASGLEEMKLKELAKG